MEGISWVNRGKTGKNSVRSPTDTICHNHDNNHPGYFSLSFLGWLWFLLLHGNLWLTNQDSETLTGSNLALIMYKTAHKISYSTDSQPHCEVAQDDDSQRNETAGNHKNNHVGLDSRVLTSTEYIRSTRSLQSMRPVPGAKTCWVYVSTDKFKAQVFQDKHQATCSIQTWGEHTTLLTRPRRTQFQLWPIWHQTWCFRKVCTQLSISPRRW